MLLLYLIWTRTQYYSKLKSHNGVVSRKIISRGSGVDRCGIPGGFSAIKPGPDDRQSGIRPHFSAKLYHIIKNFLKIVEIHVWTNNQFRERKKEVLALGFINNKYDVSQTVDDNEVVAMIQRWRIGSDDEEEDFYDTEEEDMEEETSLKATSNKYLKRDNVPTEEVVNIINDMRVEQKETEDAMDWERMKADVAKNFKETLGLSTDKEFKDWSMEKNNFMLLGHKIISEVEQSEMLRGYVMISMRGSKYLVILV
ncbi:hypothetical protein C1646_676236 [Rhizophagus diaphanus]|nr:hypothetical protein C1646_676236 [Rhizophagus diaphanus] [Rhizophagus sp. MUCL 43196]